MMDVVDTTVAMHRHVKDRGRLSEMDSVAKYWTFDDGWDGFSRQYDGITVPVMQMDDGCCQRDGCNVSSRGRQLE